MDFEVVQPETDGGGVHLRLRIPDDSPWFEGHFPGHPILPGIAHLEIVSRALAWWPSVLPGVRPRVRPSACQTDSREHTEPAPLASVPQLRLRRPVLPGDVLDLVLGAPGPGGSVSFELRREGEPVSNGTVILAG